MRCLVLGAAGQIGVHLVNRLKADGHYVVGLDRKMPPYGPSTADEFLTFDLRWMQANEPLFAEMDEIYQLAAEVGGMGFLMDRDNDAMILRNSLQVNLNVAEAVKYNYSYRNCRPRLFFASSACVYPSNVERGCREEDAYPYDPAAEGQNAYAFEKLAAEQIYQAYAACCGIDVRIGRLHNCFGPLGTWTGGREKAPAAIARKIAEADPWQEIEIWGDGQQRRSFMFVDDGVDGIIRLTRHPTFAGPVNIGSAELMTIDQMAQTIMAVADKQVRLKHVPGPQGVRGRQSDNTLILKELGWAPRTPFWVGMKKTYPWIAEQVEKARQRLPETA